MVRLEVEVDTLEQLRLALTRPGVDAVLLDNMPPPTLREAVAIVAGRAVTEASGGVTPATLREVAATGVDIVSLGWLTHSAPGSTSAGPGARLTLPAAPACPSST
jgi:nicotinate-nucleotide pyrophosphorylase (carboxylating)